MGGFIWSCDILLGGKAPRIPTLFGGMRCAFPPL
jgi:hypothetical protein